MFCSAELDLPAALRHQTVAHSAAVLETSCRSAGGKKEAFLVQIVVGGRAKAHSSRDRQQTLHFVRLLFVQIVLAGSAPQGAWPRQVRRPRRGSHLQSAVCRRTRGGSG